MEIRRNTSTECLFKSESIAEIFQGIRQERPLLHMIPNNVSAALCADGLSALGARPLMAAAPEEMKEIVSQADGIVVNLGQLNQEKIQSARLAVSEAVRLGKPLVLDPVGCGASGFRMEFLQELLELFPYGIIKGNASEIYSIQQKTLTREGIDSMQNREFSGAVPQQCTFLVTGEKDCILSAAEKLEIVHSGKRRYNIVGTGCLAGAVTGACYSIAMKIKKQNGQEISCNDNAWTDKGAQGALQNVNWRTACQQQAALAASLGMAFVLEQADKQPGYGTAKQALLDALGQLSERSFQQWLEQSMEGLPVNNKSKRRAE